MIGAWSRIVARMTAPEDPLPLALFRIGVALAVLVSVGSVVSHDLVGVLWLDADAGGYRALGRGPWLIRWLGGPTPEIVWPLVWTSLASATLLLIGAGGRVTAFVSLQTLMAVVDINGHAGGSYDELTKNALWLLVLAPSTATWSVDAWVLRGSPFRGRPVPAWARVLPVVQIVLVYWTTGLQKVSAYWVPGGDLSALYYILQQPSWQRWDLSIFAYVYPLTQLATGVTWLWEVTSPLWLLALWYRATRERSGWVRAWFNAWDVRTIYAVVGVIMHAALTVTLDVGPFPVISLAFYPLFWTGAELRTLPRGLRRASTTAGATVPISG